MAFDFYIVATIIYLICMGVVYLTLRHRGVSPREIGILFVAGLVMVWSSPYLFNRLGPGALIVFYTVVPLGVAYLSALASDRHRQQEMATVNGELVAEIAVAADPELIRVSNQDVDSPDITKARKNIAGYALSLAAQATAEEPPVVIDSSVQEVEPEEGLAIADNSEKETAESLVASPDTMVEEIEIIENETTAEELPEVASETDTPLPEMEQIEEETAAGQLADVELTVAPPAEAEADLIGETEEGKSERIPDDIEMEIRHNNSEARVDDFEMRTQLPAAGTEEGISPVIREQDSDEVLAEGLDNRIDFLLEEGFTAKFASRWEEAIHYFRQALGLTPESSLKALLVRDITAMYQEMGDYSSPREVLENYLEGELPEEEIREITRELWRIRLLEQELVMHKMAGIPYRKVPRLLRMRVDDMLGGLDISKQVEGSSTRR